MKKLLVIAMLLPWLANAQITNVSGGLFTNATIWAGGVAPTITDIACVTGFTVTVDSPIIVSGLVQRGGTMLLSNYPSLEILGAGLFKSAGTMTGDGALVVTQQNCNIRLNSWNFPSVILGNTNLTIFLTNGVTVFTSNIIANGGTVNFNSFPNWTHACVLPDCGISVNATSLWTSFRDFTFQVKTNATYPNPNVFRLVPSSNLSIIFTNTANSVTLEAPYGIHLPWNAGVASGNHNTFNVVGTLKIVTPSLKGARNFSVSPAANLIVTNGYLLGTVLTARDLKGLNVTDSVWTNSGDATFFIPTNAITDRCRWVAWRNDTLTADDNSSWSGVVQFAGSASDTFSGYSLKSAVTVNAVEIQGTTANKALSLNGYALTANIISNAGLVLASNSTIIAQNFFNAGSGVFSQMTSTVQLGLDASQAVLSNVPRVYNVASSYAGKSVSIVSNLTVFGTLSFSTSASSNPGIISGAPCLLTLSNAGTAFGYGLSNIGVAAYRPLYTWGGVTDRKTATGNVQQVGKYQIIQ